MWDNDELINDIMKLVKNHLGADLLDYQQLDWFKTLLNHYLRQFRKKFNDNVKKIIGMTIVNKKGFVHYLNGDAGKCMRNLFCEQHDRKDLKAHVKKVSELKNIRPSMGEMQVYFFLF